VRGEQAREDRMDEAGGPQGTSGAGDDAFGVGGGEFLRMLVGHETGPGKVVGAGGPGHI